MKLTDKKRREELRKYFQKSPEIEAVYIFGSQATGKVTPLSDIDIALLVNRERINEKDYPYGYNAHVTADLMALLKRNNIDLIILNDASVLLKHRVIYYGKLIYNINEKKRIDFQVETINK